MITDDRYLVYNVVSGFVKGRKIDHDVTHVRNEEQCLLWC